MKAAMVCVAGVGYQGRAGPEGRVGRTGAAKSSQTPASHAPVPVGGGPGSCRSAHAHAHRVWMVVSCAGVIV